MVILIFVPLYALSFSPAFKTYFPLSVIFSNLVTMCLVGAYFGFILPEHLESVDLWFSSDSDNRGHCFFGLIEAWLMYSVMLVSGVPCVGLTFASIDDLMIDLSPCKLLRFY